MKAAHQLAAAMLLVMGCMAAPVGYGQVGADDDDDDVTGSQDRGIEPYVEYRKHIESTQNVAPLDIGLFGEQASLYNGSTQFSLVDIEVPGNSELPVRLSRRHAIQVQPQRLSSNDYDERLAGIGNWDVEVPYMAATYRESTGWNADRCSSGSVPPTTIGPNGMFYRSEVWQGITVHVPGRAEVAALGVQVQTPRPSTGGPYRLTSTARDVFECIPLQVGETDGADIAPDRLSRSAEEGFRMITTSGLRYDFDIMTTRTAATLEETWWASDGSPETLLLQRKRYYLLASKIEDRFGNMVQFEYNSNGHPTRIWSNDGREIVLTYPDGRLATATSHGQTWHYHYEQVAGEQRLATVTRPDGSQWQYDYSNTLRPTVPASNYLPPLPECQNDQPIIDHAYTLEVEHPGGATGVFAFNNSRHYRSGVHAGECVLQSVEPELYKLLKPHYFDVMSLHIKTITGPGLTAMTWEYDYGSNFQTLWGNYGEPFSYPCTTCDLDKTVTVTEPDASQQRYRFGTLYQVNDGRQLEVETLSAGSATLRSEVYNYMDESAVGQQPFHGEYGSVLGGVADPVTARNRPVIERTISQQNTSFHRIVNSFDAFARPLEVTLASSQGDSRTELNSYHDQLSLWVLGQIEQRTVAGLVTEETTYDPSRSVPLVSKRFGKTVQSLSWDTSATVASGQRGTVSTVSDGNNNLTTLSDWKRGIPQSIEYADGQSTSALVNDDGTMAYITDENGYKTCYAYDSMGRLEQITWPSESQSDVCDTSTWNPTIQSFVQAGGSAYGLPAGHWRQTVSTGDARTITYFDALWRPAVVREYDTGDPTATERFSRFAYDHHGRTTFSAYPSASSSASDGVRSHYDALGRVTTVEQDSGLGVLTTTTTYDHDKAGYHTTTTDPRGYVTRTWYQAFDQPDYEALVAIEHPEDAYTRIDRDDLGQPRWVQRRNGSGSESLTRHYVYNHHRELCKTVEPETGATIMAYDAAGNLDWSKSGSTLTGTTDCNTGDVVQAQRTTHQYDPRNRLTALNFPDGRGNTVYTYTLDGLPETITASNGTGDLLVTTTYEYNRRRLQTHEHLQWGASQWTLVTDYNANGHVNAHNDPVGGLVSYAANALGQPTRVGNFVTNVTYHPNGAVSSFTYGNGIHHALAQNLRGLPSASTHSFGVTAFLADGYSYDANGNVEVISDDATGTGQRGHRAMTYDGLNRLHSVSSPMFGTADYRYDALDNLSHVCLSGGAHSRDHIYGYDNGRLTSIHAGNGCEALGVDALFADRFELNLTGTASQLLIDLDYDDQGNLTSRTGATFDFDHGNRLRSATIATATSHYAYDGLGLRVRDRTAGGDKYSLYSQDGLLRFADDQRQGIRSSYYYLGGRLVAVRERTAGNQLIGDKYQHTDALGSPVVVTDVSRTVLERREYEPYGVQLTPAPEDGPGYTGHVYDTATGLNYMQQRYYDPMIGRFLSVDPVTPNRETGAQFNRYWYANNNPYKFVDPDGRQSTGEWLQARTERAFEETNGGPAAFGWVLAETAWATLGAESLSQAVDKGWSNVGGGDQIGAILETSIFIAPVKIAKNVGNVANVTKGAAAVRHGPMNPGPLPAGIANTFRGGSYTDNTLGEATTLYRVHGGTAGQLGGYWTRTPPAGPLQSRMDLALRPEWGNTATQVTRIRVPAGTTIYEGAAAGQGGLVGGGSQVFIQRVDPRWVVP